MNSHARLGLALTASVILGACGASTPPPTDASVPDVRADVPVIDAPADVALSDTTPPRDSSECEDFTGYFTTASECSVTGITLPTGACVSQSGCTVTMATERGVFVGPAHGATASVSTDVSFGGMSVHIDCTLTHNPTGDLSVVCDGAGVTCTGVSTRGSVAGASRLCCDVAAQDCGAGRRCTLVASPTADSPDVAACLPTTGTAAEGDACVYNGSARGRDTCGAGLYCGHTGARNSGTGLCRRMCSLTNPTCPDGTVCSVQSLLTDQGVCLPPCTPFGGGCSAETRCAPGSIITTEGKRGAEWVCHGIGSTRPGEVCGGARDACIENYFCVSLGGTPLPSCHALCDRDHPCVGGGACVGFSNNPSGATLGVCP